MPDTQLRLFYYHLPYGNFGDELNSWLWGELLPGRWSRDSETLFSGIGTIIGNPMPPAKKVIIFTSGMGYSPIPHDFEDPRWQVAAVRGPLTARVLGLDPETAVTDGAALLSTLPRMAPIAEAKRTGVVFVPHHAAMAFGGWSASAKLAGIELLDPRRPCEQVIERIRTAKLVIADSMHAAIVADTLRVPWVPVVTSSHINTFKWLDWTLSMGVPYEPIRLPAPSVAAAFEDWTEQFQQNAFHVDPPTAENALDHYHRSIKAMREAHKPTNRRWKRYRFSRLGRRLLREPITKPIQAAFDQKRIDTTASALSRLQPGGGYLSDARTLQSHANELGRRLSAVAMSEH